MIPADYRWCSHRAYLGGDSFPWLTTDFGLSLFSMSLEQARSAYARFLSLPANDEELENEAHLEDPRILGGDRFINNIPFVPYKPRSPLTLKQLAEKLCEQYDVRVDVLRSRSSARSLTPIRLQLLQQAIDQRIASLTEVARFLDRDPSTLCKLAGSRVSKVQ